MQIKSSQTSFPKDFFSLLFQEKKRKKKKRALQYNVMLYDVEIRMVWNGVENLTFEIEIKIKMKIKIKNQEERDRVL